MQLHLLQLGHLGTRIDGWTASGARRGIEYRYPLLDRRVLEFALGLPPEQFRRGRWSRWLMRHAVSCQATSGIDPPATPKTDPPKKRRMLLKWWVFR